MDKAGTKPLRGIKCFSQYHSYCEQQCILRAMLMNTSQCLVVPPPSDKIGQSTYCHVLGPPLDSRGCKRTDLFIKDLMTYEEDR